MLILTPAMAEAINASELVPAAGFLELVAALEQLPAP
jgi:hypothetical protein